MTNEVDQAERRLQKRRDDAHRRCVACSPDGVLGVRCAVEPDGSVTAAFQPAGWMAGYDGLLHGGIVAAVLDAAATQCLFARGIEGVTAILRVRYRRPAPVDRRYTVGARIEGISGSRFRLDTELRLDDAVVADAEAVFVERP